MPNLPTNRVCARLPCSEPGNVVVLVGDDSCGEPGTDALFLGEPSFGATWAHSRHTDVLYDYSDGTRPLSPVTVADAAALVDDRNVEAVFTATLAALNRMVEALEIQMERQEFEIEDTIRETADAFRRELSYAVSVNPRHEYPGLTRDILLIDARLATGSEQSLID